MFKQNYNNKETLYMVCISLKHLCFFKKCEKMLRIQKVVIPKKKHDATL